MSDPLWKILLKSKGAERGGTLTCEECFVLVEQLAEQVLDGADWKSAMQVAQAHLARCPECREHHWRRLSELVARRRANTH